MLVLRGLQGSTMPGLLASSSQPRMAGIRALSTVTLPIYQLDAFAANLFGGNPAAVVPLDKWLPDETMMQIAAENNLSETAFYVPSAEDGADYHLRWFTPTLEVDCCGHATLATAALIMGKLEPQRQSVAFETKSGKLVVNRAAKAAAGAGSAAAPGAALPQLTLDFPPWPVGAELEAPPADLVARRSQLRRRPPKRAIVTRRKVVLLLAILASGFIPTISGEDEAVRLAVMRGRWLGGWTALQALRSLARRPLIRLESRPPQRNARRMLR